MRGLGIGPLTLLKVIRELRDGGKHSRPVSIGGARELVPLLARELRAGGDSAAVIEHRLGDACALVWIGAADKGALRAASRARIPIIGVTDGESLPYVLDSDVVKARRGEGLPTEDVARALARVLGNDGPGLAARLPVLREAVIGDLIRAASRQNALIGAAVFVPGVDMPILTLNELRLVLRIAIASGREVDQSLLPEVVAVVGAAFGWRRVAEELLDLVPVVGWAVKGGVAFTGTKAIGEAARLRFQAGSSTVTPDATTATIPAPSDPGPTLSEVGREDPGWP